MKHLVFQIAAPIQSWGNEGARQERPTDDHPRKSAILGMLGAAAGKTREDSWHAVAAAELGFATVVLRAGHRMSDYHTVLTPRGSKVYATRREEVDASDYTVETVREYLSDAHFLVALWSRGGEMDLERLAQALERPTFEIFAGRKSCSLSLPPAPIVVDVVGLGDAFLAYRGQIHPRLMPKQGANLRFYWETHPSTGAEPSASSMRQDEVVNRQRSLFRSRQEHFGSLAF